MAGKKRRLQEIIDKQRQHSLESNQQDIGKTYQVLVMIGHLLIGHLLDIKHYSQKDLTAVALSKDTGSYTGLRIRAAAQQGFAMQWIYTPHLARGNNCITIVLF